MNDTHTPVIQDLINTSADLVEATVEIEKQASLVPALQKQAADADAKLAKMAKAESDLKDSLRAGAQKCADVLELRGFKINKQAFVDRIVANPVEVFAVIEKVAAESSAPQLGAGDDTAKTASEASATTDPIEAWLNEGE